MMTKRILVVGATGDVGRGVTQVGLAQGWSVVAVGRDKAKLEAFAKPLDAGDRLQTIEGSFADEASAAKFLSAAKDIVGSVDAALVSIKGQVTPKPMLEWTPDELVAIVRQDLIPHYVAAKVLIPAMKPGSLYISVGGGMWDFVPPKNGHVSMMQAAQRNMFRAITQEYGAGPVKIRELIIASMVNGLSKREIADARWLTDEEIGRHVYAVIDNLERFPEPILTLRSRKRIGLPESDAPAV